MPSLPSGVAALLALFQTQGALQRALESDGRISELTAMENQLLVYLGEPLRMGELAQVLHCLPSNVTALVDQLEGKGLVRREPCPEDRRAKLLVLTRKGRSVRERLIAATTEIFAETTGLDESGIVQLLDLLSRRPH